MTDKTKIIALALTPQTEILAGMLLLKALKQYHVVDNWLKAKQIVKDLEDIAPQVVWIESSLQDAFEESMMDINIETRVVSQYEAEKINRENKPVRGTIDLKINTRDFSINDEMIKELKSKNLISGCRMGNNSNDIYYWKDDRWNQDFHLTIFRKSDIRVIETLINRYGYIVVQTEK